MCFNYKNILRFLCTINYNDKNKNNRNHNKLTILPNNNNINNYKNK